MKAVLMSIHPKWCARIANGEKTVEIRKSAPKIQTPFRCYIYCTKGVLNPKYGKYLHTSNIAGALYGWDDPNDCDITVQPDNYTYRAYACGGKVVGEFICDEIIKWSDDKAPPVPLKDTCLSYSEIRRYAPTDKDIFCWHISDITIYNKPKELSEYRLTRPPQSWCYVKEAS